MAGVMPCLVSPPQDTPVIRENGMYFQSAKSNIEFEFPPADRPPTLNTFVCSGLAVKWSAPPTTSEFIALLIAVSADFDEEIELVTLDPSDDNVENWVFKIDSGPISLPVGMSLKVRYANTDGNTVTVVFLGEWR